jgi:hypothetical protein
MSKYFLALLGLWAPAANAAGHCAYQDAVRADRRFNATIRLLGRFLRPRVRMNRASETYLQQQGTKS